MEKGHPVTTIGLLIYGIIGFAGAVSYGIGHIISLQALQYEGAPDAAMLADGVTAILIGKIVAISGALFGGVLAGVGMLYLEDRRRMVWWGLLVGSIPLLAIWPVGTIIAAFMLTYLIANKAAFLAS